MKLGVNVNNFEENKQVDFKVDIPNDVAIGQFTVYYDQGRVQVYVNDEPVLLSNKIGEDFSFSVEIT